MHYLDPSVKDTVQLIQGSYRKNGSFRSQERRGLYPDEFDRLTAIGKQRVADEEADRQERREKVDAEVERLEAENARYKAGKGRRPSRSGMTGSRQRKPSSKKSGLSITPKVKASRANRNALIQAAETTCTEAVAPLALKLRIDGATPSEKNRCQGQGFPKRIRNLVDVPARPNRSESRVWKRSWCLRRRETRSGGRRKGLPSKVRVGSGERSCTSPSSRSRKRRIKSSGAILRKLTSLSST